MLQILCRLVGVAVVCVLFGSCEPATLQDETIPSRWYTAQQVELGRTLFQTHCANCHGKDAEGIAEDWRRRDSDGNYPPPPLNGTAHAWHHPLTVLERTILEGGVPLGGVMPGYLEILNGNEIRATIAYFQSFWMDEIYVTWEEINAR